MSLFFAEVDPSIVVELRYFGAHNFMGWAMLA
jgi:D-alanyl-D-alanine dipeptidase